MVAAKKRKRSRPVSKPKRRKPSMKQRLAEALAAHRNACAERDRMGEDLRKARDMVPSERRALWNSLQAFSPSVGMLPSFDERRPFDQNFAQAIARALEYKRLGEAAALELRKLGVQASSSASALAFMAAAVKEANGKSTRDRALASLTILAGMSGLTVVERTETLAPHWRHPDAQP